MYSTRYGVLWSVCTSTFIPFFSVFVTTGNSCPRAGPANDVNTHKTKNAALPNHRIVFMNPPSLNQTYLPRFGTDHEKCHPERSRGTCFSLRYRTREPASCCHPEARLPDGQVP